MRVYLDGFCPPATISAKHITPIKMQNSLRIAGVAAGLALLAASCSVANAPMKPPVTAEAPSATSSPSGWLTYTGGGLTFRYPPSWMVEGDMDGYSAPELEIHSRDNSFGAKVLHWAPSVRKPICSSLKACSQFEALIPSTVRYTSIGGLPAVTGSGEVAAPSPEITFTYIVRSAAEGWLIEFWPASSPWIASMHTMLGSITFMQSAD